jgi:hypothetical protein
MYKACLCGLIVGLFAASASAQINVTAPPAGANAVASANDFATQQMQDPWDMSQRSDLGWWLNGVDGPPAKPGWSATSFANGVFTGTVSATGDPNLWLLETGSPALPPYTKTGDRYPINADFYRIFSMRMCAPASTVYFSFYWVTTTIYNEPQNFLPSTAVGVTPGCRIYFVDLATLGGLTPPWSGLKRALRLDPAPDNEPAGSQISIDWIRIVDNRPDLFRTVTWTGGGSVNIYLDNDNNAGNGNLGLVAQNVQGGSYSLNVGALEPGNYYVFVQPTSGSGGKYSPGFYQVNAPPTINITAPSEEGSVDDFATIQLNDPWDMTTATDIEHTDNTTNGGIYTIPTVENEAGTPLGDLTAWFGKSTEGVHSGQPCASFAKPTAYPLYFGARGSTFHIDPNRYRILTLDMGLPNKARDLCGGSIIRVVWRVAGQTFETYSFGVALNSRAGANVMARLNFDMAAIPIDPASPSQAPWAPGSAPFPGIDSFRIDPHEFADPTDYFIKRIKLAALEKAHTSYTITWTLSKAATVSAYYGTTKNPQTMTQIGTVSSGTTGSMAWNTSGLPNGAQYFIYLVANDGANVNSTFSKWPVVIDHVNTGTARIVLNRTLLNFGVRGGVQTPAQLVRLSFQGAPAGQPCWNATSDLGFISVSPSSGCGAATLTVQLAGQAPGGSSAGAIRITTGGALNSPQIVQTVVRVFGATNPPSGVLDTPANGATVSGSIGVTGWAVDDVGIARVTICRSPVGGETGHPACGPGQVYLGDGVFVDDARPDVAGVAPTSPFQYRAGWGFLVLTNMLPNQGNGTFTISANAIDLEGFRTGIGSKVINVNNAAATLPFGNIDTPLQGETISGLVPNYGWVLSRTKRADPPGGGEVFVFVDGVGIGSPGGWTSRPDLTAAFPGYPGINTALAVFGLDTSALANGLHTIMWIVRDSGGESAGVGSRFFNVFNTGASSITDAALRPSGPDIGRSLAALTAVTSAAPVLMQTGFNLNAPTTSVTPGVTGARHVRATERDRVEIRLNASTRASGDRDYAGYLVVDGQLRELPIGSSFDPRRGVFYWQPGLAFTGGYDFLFVRTRADGTRERIPVRVTLEPREPARFASAREPWRVSF